MKILNIIEKPDCKSIVLIGKKFIDKQDFFTTPYKSSEIDIFKVKKLDSILISIPLSKILIKIVLLPYKNYFLCLPMRHKEFQFLIYLFPLR